MPYGSQTKKKESVQMIREYRTICDLSEQFLTATKIQGVTCGELGEVVSPKGDTCACQVLEVDDDKVLAVFLESPMGLDTETCKVRFFGHSAELPLSEDLLGRTWNSQGEPLDGGPSVLPEKYASIDAHPINPLAREGRTETIQIKGEPPLRLGERRTITSNPHSSIAKTVAQLARSAKIEGEDKPLTIVISAIGLPFAARQLLTDELRRRGLTAQTTVFASDPADKPILRLQTSYTAMTAAEYFAFDREQQVLFIEAEVETMAEAFAETMQSVSILPWEPPGRAGHPPSYPYADLTALEDRIGCRKGKAGSITMLRIRP